MAVQIPAAEATTAKVGGSQILMEGAKAAGSAAGSYVGQGLFRPSVKKVERSNKRMAEFNMALNERAAQRAHERTLELNKLTYEQSSYQNLMKQMEESGLNKSLAMGSAGATGGGSGSSNQGAEAGAVHAEAPNIAGLVGAGAQSMAVVPQLMLAMSQKNALDAKAELDRAEAKKIGGVDTDLAKTQMTGILANVRLTQAEEENTRIRSVGQKLDNDYQTILNGMKEATAPSEIKLVQNQVEDFHYRWGLMAEQVNNLKADTETKNTLRNGTLNVLKAQTIEMLSAAGLADANAAYQRIENSFAHNKIGAEINNINAGTTNYQEQADLARMQQDGILTAEEVIELQERGQNANAAAGIIGTAIMAGSYLTGGAIANKAAVKKATDKAGKLQGKTTWKDSAGSSKTRYDYY